MVGPGLWGNRETRRLEVPRRARGGGRRRVGTVVSPEACMRRGGSNERLGTNDRMRRWRGDEWIEGQGKATESCNRGRGLKAGVGSAGSSSSGLCGLWVVGGARNVGWQWLPRFSKVITECQGSVSLSLFPSPGGRSSCQLRIRAREGNRWNWVSVGLANVANGSNPRTIR